MESGIFRQGFVRWLLLAAAAVACLGMLSSSIAVGADGGRWQTAALEEGKAEGFSWAVAAKGPNNSLDRICALAGVLAPPAPNSPYAEGDNLTVCGSLAKATDSVSLSAVFGSSGSSLQFILYRPSVRKVMLLLSTGKRKVFQSQAPEIPNRGSEGIPAFRYLATIVEGGACIRGITTFDKKGRVLSKEGEPCSGGS